MAWLVRNGNVETVQDGYSFGLGFFPLFFPNNPFGPLTTNERTNDICIHIAISILFIHRTYPIPAGFSFLFFVCFFRSLG